jgi:PKD repeat protein
VDGPDGIDVETKINYIDVLHLAAFIGGPDTGIAPHTAYFVDESGGIPTSWLWDFGDGKTSTQRHPSHKYYDVGSYDVSLTITTANGPDTLTKTDYIVVTDYGVPVITTVNPVSCEPNDKIRIRGYNFGDIQGDSVLHINKATLDASSVKMKLWSNTRITIKVPNYKCTWFNGEPSRNRKVWVTVDGVDSNGRLFEVVKPTSCP